MAILQIDPGPAEKFFGLSARPFSLTPDLRFAYHSRSHTHALEQVTSALRRREGLVVVTGPIGTGKTMLCRSMLESFESRTFLSVILDPGLEVEDLLRQVLTDFGIMRAIDAPASGPLSDVTRHQYVSTLQQFLGSLIPLQAHAVIMIDEAQRLNARVLEEIRLLSNFETDEAKLLQIVLVGQPDLDEVLRRADMRQLNQRVARRCELYPLSESEVGDYIERRLTVAASPEALAGDDPAATGDMSRLARFSPDAVKTVAQLSEGIPRVVNTLCDRALDVAYERQTRVVDADAVAAAAARLQIAVPAAVTLTGGRQVPKFAALAAAAAIAVAGVGWWWTSSSREATAPTTAKMATAPAAASSARSPNDEVVPGSAAAAAASAQAAAAPASAVPDAQASPAAGAPAATGFEIAVAAFRTEARAEEVVAALRDLQVPAAVRGDSTGTWQRVIAGPFATREAVQAAQESLTRAGYGDTRITSAR